MGKKYKIAITTYITLTKPFMARKGFEPNPGETSSNLLIAKPTIAAAMSKKPIPINPIIDKNKLHFALSRKAATA